MLICILVVRGKSPNDQEDLIILGRHPPFSLLFLHQLHRATAVHAAQSHTLRPLRPPGNLPRWSRTTPPRSYARQGDTRQIPLLRTGSVLRSCRLTGISNLFLDDRRTYRAR